MDRHVTRVAEASGGGADWRQGQNMDDVASAGPCWTCEGPHFGRECPQATAVVLETRYISRTSAAQWNLMAPKAHSPRAGAKTKVKEGITRHREGASQRHVGLLEISVGASTGPVDAWAVCTIRPLEPRIADRTKVKTHRDGPGEARQGTHGTSSCQHDSECFGSRFAVLADEKHRRIHHSECRTETDCTKAEECFLHR